MTIYLIALVEYLWMQLLVIVDATPGDVTPTTSELSVSEMIELSQDEAKSDSDEKDEQEEIPKQLK